MAIYINDYIDIIVNKSEKTVRIYDLIRRQSYNMEWILFLYLCISDQYSTDFKLTEAYQSIIDKNISFLYDNKILVYDKKHKNFNEAVRYEQKNPLKNVQLEITTACNFNCKHCFNSVNRNNILSLKKIKDIVNDCKNMGVHMLSLTGGEPLVHPDFKQIVEYISHNNIQYTVYTNGYLLNEKMILFLKQNNVSNIRISLDGFSEHIHDTFRNFKGSYNKIIEASKMLIYYKLPFEFNSMLHKYNNDILKFQHFVENEIGNIKIIFDYILNIGNAKNLYNDFGLELDDFCDIYSNYLKELLVKGLKFDTNQKKYCGIGCNYIYITAEGLVKICPTVDDSVNIGNINTHLLFDIWQSKKMAPYYNMHCENISKCKFSLLCKGGCRCRGQLFSPDKNFYFPDLVYCKIFKNLSIQDLI